VGTIHSRSPTRIGLNWRCVSATQSVSSMRSIDAGRASGAPLACERGIERRGDVGLEREERAHQGARPERASAPGSPKTAFSRDVPASASEISVASAPLSSSASESASAWRPSTTSASVARPRLPP
jgi:hypothetical protein